jgi:peroxiredoxin
MTDLSCPYCSSALDPRGKFCPACGAPLDAPPVVDAPPEPKAPAAEALPARERMPVVEALPDLEAAIRAQAAPARRSKLPGLVWVAVGAVVLCLCAAACAVACGVAAGALIFLPVEREQSWPAIPTAEVMAPAPTSIRPDPVNPATPLPEPAVAEAEGNPELIPTEAPLPTPRPEGSPYVGELAPEFTLLEANTGESVTLSAFTGQPVVLHFWTTWCTYCEEEFATLQSAYEAYQGNGLVVLAVDSEERRSDVVAYGQAHELTFPLLLDEDGDITNDAYRVTGFPTSVFIFPDGMISFIQVGTMTHNELYQQIEAIMTP